MSTSHKHSSVEDTVSTPTESGPTYTWDAVSHTIGPATADDQAIYAVHETPALLVLAGARIRSERILTDVLRWSGQIAEFWPHATEAQQNALLGFSSAYLRVFFQQGVVLRDLVARHGSHDAGRAVTLEKTTAQAHDALERGQHRREQLHNALRGLKGSTASWATEVAAAYSMAATPDELAASLLAEVSLGRGVLAHPHSVEARRLVSGRVTGALLDDTEALAAEVKHKGNAILGAKAQGTVTQASLDLQDGVCLHLMTDVLRIFTTGHDADPTIPLLQPIATRRLFIAHAKVSTPDAPATTPTATPGPA